MTEAISRSKKETQKFAALFALEVAKESKSVIIGLSGNLGAGKTTFVQGFATALGIKENVLSPTFVLMKLYKIKKGKKKHLIHVDCYRMDSASDAKHLGLEKLFKDRDAVILIEWAERIKKILPKNTHWIRFRHGKKINERIIRLQS